MVINCMDLGVLLLNKGCWKQSSRRLAYQYTWVWLLLVVKLFDLGDSQKLNRWDDTRLQATVQSIGRCLKDSFLKESWNQKTTFIISCDKPENVLMRQRTVNLWKECQKLHLLIISLITSYSRCQLLSSQAWNFFTATGIPCHSPWYTSPYLKFKLS